MRSNIKVAHLTSAHPRYDTRIFLKECVSLVRHGLFVSLIVDDTEKYGVYVGKNKAETIKMRN
ncbi:hypothetical protein [Neptuniibacter marinus]|uniref:hypothetical protein n=1 Tax=Neptuniibacter marinus TaxID=1806670 RepID=UPI000832F01A|nr:hypothetical protein [Neptuniibacter marinus]